MTPGCASSAIDAAEHAIDQIAKQLAELFKAQVVDVDRKSLVLEITTTPETLASFTNLLQPLGIVELVRTGTVAIGRGRG